MTHKKTKTKKYYQTEKQIEKISILITCFEAALKEIIRSRNSEEECGLSETTFHEATAWVTQKHDAHDFDFSEFEK